MINLENILVLKNKPQRYKVLSLYFRGFLALMFVLLFIPRHLHHRLCFRVVPRAPLRRDN